MPSDMNKHEDIAKALKARLSELTSRVAEIDNELRKPLSADSEDQATDLENQDALGGIEYSGLQEIRQIKEALERIAKGTYGVCAQCGTDIDPKRLRALRMRLDVFHVLGDFRADTMNTKFSGIAWLEVVWTVSQARSKMSALVDRTVPNVN